MKQIYMYYIQHEEFSNALLMRWKVHHSPLQEVIVLLINKSACYNILFC